jgi:hypothetical protein
MSLEIGGKIAWTSSAQITMTPQMSESSMFEPRHQITSTTVASVDPALPST